MRWARLVFERAERIATLQPGNAAPLSRGAVALAFLGDAKRATSWIVRALTVDPDDLTTQYNAAAVTSLDSRALDPSWISSPLTAAP